MVKIFLKQINNVFKEDSKNWHVIFCKYLGISVLILIYYTSSSKTFLFYLDRGKKLSEKLLPKKYINKFFNFLE